MLMIYTIQMPVIQNFKRNVILRKNSHMKTTTALFSSFFNYIFNFAGKKTTLAYHLMVILSSLSFMFEFNIQFLAFATFFLSLNAKNSKCKQKHDRNFVLHNEDFFSSIYMYLTYISRTDAKKFS